MGWSGAIVFFFWVNTVPVWRQWRFDPGHCGRRLLHSAGPASMSRLRGMQSCPCKAAGKLSHINNKIQSSPCFFFFFCLQGWPALGRMTHVHILTELSLSPLPGSPCIDLSSPKKKKKGKNAMGEDKKRKWFVKRSDVAMRSFCAHKGFLPSRGQTSSMHVWEQGNGGQLMWMVGEAVWLILNSQFNQPII